jgi:CpeS-like protein
MDVMEFFQLSAGKWLSQRTTHHLAFRLAEAGESEIQIEALGIDHPKVLEICELHQVDHSLAVGGSFVSWQASMGWDRADENHEGSTVFVLVPETPDARQGTLLRERGYAEIVPVAGRYHMDDEGALVLTTEYETMSSVERFWFASPSLRMRTSTVKRFGGFSTATFCTEFRIADTAGTDVPADQVQNAGESTKYSSFFGW